MNCSRDMGCSMVLVAFCSPRVHDRALEMLRPQAEPAPWAGYTSVSSGNTSSLVCNESYIIPAICSAVWPLAPTRSGRPTSPMNSVSPVSSFAGAPGSAPSDTSTHRLSGVCPGVSRKRRVTRPRRSSSPSWAGRWS